MELQEKKKPLSGSVLKLIAVITMQIMSNGLVTLGCDSTWRDIFKALFLLVLLIFSGNQPYFTKWRQDMNRAKIANDDYERRVQQG